MRQKILKKCREDIYAWLNHENGQVAIYDAVNPVASGRRSLAKEFAKHDVQVASLHTTTKYRPLRMKLTLTRHCLLNRTSMTSGSSKRTLATSRYPLPM